MGITYWDIKSMQEAQRGGYSFGNVLTIGRQSLFLNPREVAIVNQAHLDAVPSSPSLPLKNYKSGNYVDDFIREGLGATSVTSMDFSDYEGATIVHDLNRPVPDQLFNRFDTIIDGGSLEHIFNFPIAISNLMRMLKPGGRLFITVPANNLCGHGFYQFSPELMFRIFTSANGFDIKQVVLVDSRYPSVEWDRKRRAYNVTDPAIVHCRVGLLSRKAAMMMVQAIKREDVVPFAAPPLQSDYVQMWDSAESKINVVAQQQTAKQRPVLRRLYDALPALLRNSIHHKIFGYHQRRKYSFSNAAFYRELPVRAQQ